MQSDKIRNKTSTASTNSLRTNNSSDIPLHGNFNGHTVSIDASLTTTSRCEFENTPDDYDEGIKKFAFICCDPKALIRGYLESYTEQDFEFDIANYYSMSIGKMDGGSLNYVCRS